METVGSHVMAYALPVMKVRWQIAFPIVRVEGAAGGYTNSTKYTTKELVEEAIHIYLVSDYQD